MKAMPTLPLLGGEAKATEVVSDELKVPEVNSFAKGEPIAHQTFTVSSDGDGR
jgi:hypothetical protein